MKNRYNFTLRLRASDFDCNRQIKPSAILDLFQEAAGAHAKELGIGFEDIIEKGLLWVITKEKFEVLKQPKMHSEVVVHTWPLEPSRVTFQREYLIESTEGEPLVKGTSEWVIVSAEKRRIVPVKDLYPLDSYVEDRMFEGKFTKATDFEAADFESRVTPAFCDLDMNCHVNNIKYADYVLNAIDLKGSKITFFQLDFHKEVKKDDEICLLIAEQGEQILAKGLNAVGEKMFCCEIKVK
ncbi:MAG: hypothetical protein IJ027_05350 [Oscillospiraceae bacterium]|nr:hypothetical protein [Oscillospiraceae bacterium]